MSDVDCKDSIGDEVVSEYDVVVCDSLQDTQMYCVAFPSRKKDVWNTERNPAARFKKNVRVLEVRMSPDVATGSFDKKKAQSLAENASKSGIDAFGEVYEGRAFQNDNPVCKVIGYFKNGKLFLCPMSGTFEMHRSIAFMNKKGAGNKDTEGELSDESDSEQTSGGNPLRVKFSRPETDRQKKRREASALHREKKIASDVWIPMNVHLKEENVIHQKMEGLTVECSENGEEKKSNATRRPDENDVRDLVNKAIVCAPKEELLVESGKEHMLSKQRIKELEKNQQVKAHLIKSHVVRTDEIKELVFPKLDQTCWEKLIEQLRECAQLVQGVWVLKSEFLFRNLPPAHSNVPGRVDEYRSDLWRNARDLALCLLDAGHRVTRNTITTCFRLNSRDAEEILSTFGVRDEDERTWKLRIDRDEQFLAWFSFLNDWRLNVPKEDVSSLENYAVVVAEKKAWLERWEELQSKIGKSASPKRAPQTKNKSG